MAEDYEPPSPSHHHSMARIIILAREYGLVSA